jgi:hypothetical protein
MTLDLDADYGQGKTAVLFTFYLHWKTISAKAEQTALSFNPVIFHCEEIRVCNYN